MSSSTAATSSSRTWSRPSGRSPRTSATHSARSPACAPAPRGWPSPSRRGAVRGAQAEAQLSGAVRNLLVSVEAYPQLQSNQNFLELQRQPAETEIASPTVAGTTTPTSATTTRAGRVGAHQHPRGHVPLREGDVLRGQRRRGPGGPRRQLRRDLLPRRRAAGGASGRPRPGASDPNALPNPQQQPYPPQQSIPQQPYPQQPYPQQAAPPPAAGCRVRPAAAGAGYVPPQSYPQQGPGYTLPQG